MSAHEPSERALIARIAANARWARTTDRTKATEPARRGLLEKFAHQVDPGSVLDPVERYRRAQNLVNAHMAKMALRSAQARRKAGVRRKPEMVEAQALATAMPRGEVA
jgi:hypothetical protein